jgi:2-amino-4-hydroxy-6-hydroxymethyldihydropteridine diphosphokinase
MNISVASRLDMATETPLEARSPLLHEAWLGLGSNLGDRLGQIKLVLQHFSSHLIELSPIFETAPWGVLEQPWFLNGVARLHWEGSAFELLEACLDCETSLGRVRTERNGPRVIDLDVLVHGTDVLDQPGLTVPHPGISMRRSVLEPWSLVAPELVVPGQDCTLIELRERALSFTDQAVRPFEP